MNGGQTYRANGLTFDSEIALPELAPAEGQADVVIRFGATPAEVERPLATGSWYQAATGQYLLKVPSVASYWATNGNRVTVAPEPAASADMVRNFLIASVLGAVAHQRGFLPLHANAVRLGARCVLLVGPSGAGKSTLAAAFHERGHRLVAEDLCAISLDAEGWPVVHPGYLHVKLWEDALARFAPSLGPARAIRPGVGKYSVQLPSIAPEALRVSEMYLLSSGPPGVVAFDEVHGAAKLWTVRRQTYRRRLARGCGDPLRHFALCRALAERVRLTCVERPLQLGFLGEVVRRIEDHARAGVAP